MENFPDKKIETIIQKNSFLDIKDIKENKYIPSKQKENSSKIKISKK